MKAPYLFLPLLVILLTGCCENCDRAYLGDYTLEMETAEWLSFSNTTTVVFKNSSGQLSTFSYADPQYGVIPYSENCVDQGSNCGLCCDQFSGEEWTYQLVSDNNNVNFTIQAKKDFLNYLPESDSDDIPDMISVKFKSQLYQEVFDVPAKGFVEHVDLNLIRYETVKILKPQNPERFAEDSDPAEIYFHQTDGIIGYKQNDGVVWGI
ncbi:hypothetical protein [Pontibacter sp. G13]|uniref:hypothetical protein n=1 Tax=Pontibacter sp. G13 TaxID=3074898 RepID=UPI0028899B86|nr:hypothetical protein [Pontibacter sp. G13]WNJ17370.1 hypothetical protein RJD25_21175 [Pontibacter sp. G13]